MIHIPSQIADFSFVKVLANEKKAFEPGAPRYKLFDKSFIQHYQKGGNYGVSGDENHVIIDCDIDELAMIIRTQLPKTFAVTSATKQKPHFYFKCKWTRGDIALTDWTSDEPRAGNIGTVRRKGYVVGPFSRVDGRQYLIADASPVAEITEEQLSEVLAPWMAQKTHTIDRDLWKGEHNALEFPITDIDGVKPGLQVHPIHGSKSNSKNLNVDAKKGLWYCFACCSGGDALQLLAVTNRIICCWEAGPGALTREKFKRTKQRAIELGLVEKTEPKRSVSNRILHHFQASPTSTKAGESESSDRSESRMGSRNVSPALPESPPYAPYNSPKSPISPSLQSRREDG